MMNRQNEKYFVARERPHLPNPVYWNPVLQTSKGVETLYGKKLSVVWNMFWEGNMNSIMLTKEWSSVGTYIAERMIDDEDYFNALSRETAKAKKKIEIFLRKCKSMNFSRLPFNQLIRLSKTIYDCFLEYDRASVFAWFVAGDIFQKKVKERLKLNDEEFNLVSLPMQKTFTTQMEYDLLTLLRKKDFEKSAKRLSSLYYWIPFSYDGPEIWDSQHFLLRLKELRKNKKMVLKEIAQKKREEIELEKKRAQIMKNVSPHSRVLLHRLHMITTWTDERKMLEFQLFYYYHQLLKRLSVLLGISPLNLPYLFLEEIQELREHKELLLTKARERRQKGFMTVTREGKITLCSDAEFIQMKKDIQSSQKEIIGSIACKGSHQIYKGTAKILLSPRKGYSIQSNDFLVATMTSPEYLPAMKTAKGFITDEGGITSHAAIVAREMNKPCIIGTKIATKVLKDGDLIEVDANQGTVTVLKRK